MGDDAAHRREQYLASQDDGRRIGPEPTTAPPDEPPTVVECPSGIYVDMKVPEPETITLGDVAHKLAQVNRWGGSARYPYSVAQHAVFVAERLAQEGAAPEVQLAGLHHDSHEAFLGDIPRPWKAMMGAAYNRLATRFDYAIGCALALPEASLAGRRLIKTADNFALLVEARNLMPSGGRLYRNVRPGMDGLPKRIITPIYYLGELDWRAARDLFLAKHEDLKEAMFE